MTPILVLDEVDSTNEEARRRYSSGERGPVWIVARHQSAGRGRRGRAWTSGIGNLYASGMYPLEVSAAKAATLSFVAALAVADLCDAFVDPETVKLKWPNDVLVNDAKISGILLESARGGEGRLEIAVGVGVNLAEFPTDADRPATSIKANLALGHSAPPTIEVAARILADAFDARLAVWREAGFPGIRDAWLARAIGVGGAVEARLPSETIKGRWAGLGPDGALMVDLSDGTTRAISAADVFFTPNPS